MADVHIVGIRGIPNRYGGFERLVECLAPALSARGHSVTVYCQSEWDYAGPSSDSWRGVTRLLVRTRLSGSLGTIEYDVRCLGRIPAGAVVLMFGYGSAFANVILKKRRIPFAVNMDGIEWKRAKWHWLARLWLRFNERIAARTSDILIADHPEVAKYLRGAYGRDSELIAYGANVATGSHAAVNSPLETNVIDVSRPFDLMIARPEPENQVHLVLQAFTRANRSEQLIVVGDFSRNAYGRELQKRFNFVKFVGPLYDSEYLDTLRKLCRYYYHGHSVGGTNPSLVEALAAGALVIAHDNAFNRWVADSRCLFFCGADDLSKLMNNDVSAARRREITESCQALCRSRYSWESIFCSYDSIVSSLHARSRPQA